MNIFVHCLFSFYKIYFEVAGVKKKVNSKVNSKEESREKKNPPQKKKRTKRLLVFVSCNTQLTESKTETESSELLAFLTVNKFNF